MASSQFNYWSGQEMKLTEHKTGNNETAPISTSDGSKSGRRSRDTIHHLIRSPEGVSHAYKHKGAPYKWLRTTLSCSSLRFLGCLWIGWSFCGTLSSLTHYPLTKDISMIFFSNVFSKYSFNFVSFCFCKLILDELQKWISPCRKTLLSILLLTETTEIRIPRILQVTHEVTYSCNVCLALLSSKVAVMTVGKGSKSWGEAGRRTQRERECITKEWLTNPKQPKQIKFCL